MLVKQLAFDAAVKILKAGIGLAGSRADLVSATLAQRLTPSIAADTKFGRLWFFCPGSTPLWRAQTLLSKEPETIEWIDRFDADTVFWDIGANVGLYSLYAALRPNMTVLAFEPAAPNYYVLNRNIELNRMEGKVRAFSLAFSDTTRLDSLFLISSECGTALHRLGQAKDWQGRDFVPSLKQGTIGFSVDDFVERFQPPFPNYLKIDVDGLEGRIVQGAVKTLSDHRIRSVLVELDTGQVQLCERVIGALKAAGLALVAKRRAALFDKTEYASIYNHIFARS
jgi:FkbM family methyltransferase